MVVSWSAGAQLGGSFAATPDICSSACCGVFTAPYTDSAVTSIGAIEQHGEEGDPGAGHLQPVAQDVPPRPVEDRSPGPQGDVMRRQRVARRARLGAGTVGAAVVTCAPPASDIAGLPTTTGPQSR